MASSNAAWICQVCGYVHRGAEPPEVCPVCGCPASDFGPHIEVLRAAPSKPRQWRCLICNYVHEGPEPPETCVVCGADASDFEPLADTPAPASAQGTAGKIVILGAGIAGVSAAEAARAASPDAEIVLLSKEKELPYYRLNLTRYLAGEMGEEGFPIHPAEWYAQQGIELVQGCEAVSLEADRHALLLDDGSEMTYDKLILACGAHAFVPPIPGGNLPGVHVLRTLDDVRALRQAAQPGVPCVCIGGGILGLEAAAGLARCGAQVTLLENFQWLLPRQLDQQGGEVLERHVRKLGIEIRSSVKITEIFGDTKVRGLALEDGSTLPAEFIVISAGVRPNTHLARRAGLDVDHGIVVDSSLVTSHPDVYAAGDVAEHYGVLYGLWEPARFQGVIAGQNAVGAYSEFGGIPRASTLKVLGVNLFSVGEIELKDGSYQSIACENDGEYRRFLFRDGHLVGAILIGDTHLASTALRAVKDHADASGLLAGSPHVDDVCAWLEAQSS